ncbi:MAG: hypothetical protein GY903_02630 [Fuerstiella sp.]|nr:hypothetical protein [Fuerstiella sp.]MCP4853373.1 hypothetical protein [Fuerstiella sp.]
MDTLAPEINNSLKIDVDDADVPMADESVDDDGSTIPLGPGEFPGIRKPFRSLWWLSHVLLGIGFLLPLMAGLAAIPGLSLLALGVMLAAQAQGAKSGRLRDGFPLLPVSTRIGTIGFMTGLFLVPIIMASSVAGAQQVISQLSGISQNGFSVLTLVLQVIVFVHLLLAIANGGSFACFLRPIRNIRQLLKRIRSNEFAPTVNVWTERLATIYRPWHHFLLAVKAVVGALCWLTIPTVLLGMSSTSPHENPGLPGFLSFVGGALMIPVAAWLPLLQVHQATTGRFKAIFEVRVVREIICRVPIRWAIATILLYALAIPLYLSKVVLPPADAYWVFTPLFILVIYPTRLLIGWVYGTGIHKQDRASRLIRWPAKVFMVPLLGLYSLILFAVPLISEAGPRAMFENHAFLLPTPSGDYE